MSGDERERFERAVAARRRASGLRAQRAGLAAGLQETLDELNILAEERAREQADVEALKAVTLASLWERLIGEHAEKLKREERELALVEVAVRETDDQVKEVRARLKAIDEAIAEQQALADDEGPARDALLLARASLGDERSARLLEVEETLALLNEDRREIEQAKMEALVLDDLDQHLVGYLEGFWKPSVMPSLSAQIVFGRGGFEGWVAKASLLGPSRSQVAREQELETMRRQEAQAMFMRFCAELDDVGRRMDEGGLERIAVDPARIFAVAPSLVTHEGRFDPRQAASVDVAVKEGRALLRFLDDQVAYACRRLEREHQDLLAELDP